MKEFFGDYVDIEEMSEYLVLSFDSTKLTLQERWRGNSISADFLAAYWGAFAPIVNPKVANTQMEDVISWTANELIENAVKFSDRDNPYPIKIFLNLSTDTLDFYVVNSIGESAKDKFKQHIFEIQNHEASELYFSRIEKNAETPGGESGLGILTMKMDLGAEVSWKFEKKKSLGNSGGDVDTVTTFVKLPIQRRDV